MKARILSSLLVLGMLSAPAWAGTGPTPRRTGALAPAEAASLRTIEEPALGDLRAGAIAKTAPIQVLERAALVAAEARCADLADLRAGDLNLSDHDLTVIAIVVGVVILILII